MEQNIDIFITYNGTGNAYQSVAPILIDKYDSILPEFLINYWRENGLCNFKDGFFSMVNPDDYAEILSFFKKDTAHCHVVLRTAFGGLIYLNQKAKIRKRIEGEERKYNYICPIRRNVTHFTDYLHDVMNGWLTTEEIYAPLMFSNLYDQARKRLPPPAPDECYAFVPAIALGGDMDPDNIALVKQKEHLLFLSQL